MVVELQCAKEFPGSLFKGADSWISLPLAQSDSVNPGILPDSNALSGVDLLRACSSTSQLMM